MAQNLKSFWEEKTHKLKENSRRMEENLEKKIRNINLPEDQLLLLQSLQVPLLLLDEELRVSFVNNCYLSVFEKPEQEVKGFLFFDLEPAWQLPRLQAAFGTLLTEKKSFKDLPGPHPLPEKGNEGLLFSASLLPNSEDHILLSFSEQKKENQEKSGSHQLQEFFFQAPAAIAIVHGPEQVYSLSNSLYEQLVNRTREELLGKSLPGSLPGDRRAGGL